MGEFDPRLTQNRGGVSYHESRAYPEGSPMHLRAWIPGERGSVDGGMDGPGPGGSGSPDPLGPWAETHRGRAGGGDLRGCERPVPPPDRRGGVRIGSSGDWEGRPLPGAADGVLDSVGGVSISWRLRGGGSRGAPGPAALAGAGGDRSGREASLRSAALGVAEAVDMAAPRFRVPTLPQGESPFSSPGLIPSRDLSSSPTFLGTCLDRNSPGIAPLGHRCNPHTDRPG